MQHSKKKLDLKLFDIEKVLYCNIIKNKKESVRIDRTSQTLDTLINLAMMPHHPSKVA